MTTRFNAGDPFGVPSGYAGANVPSGFELPSVSIEDVDRALFDYFDKDLALMVSNGRTATTKKVPVIFAGGEKWAMSKRGRSFRDKTGALILPLVTIHRKEIVQDVKKDITGRGINQQTGELVIKRRLSPLDRAYQNLVNKLGIVNQPNTSNETLTFQTDRVTGANAFDADIINGGLMAPKFGDNVWEVITIPSPQFFTATYEVTFWSQYMLHMNQILDKMMSAYLPTANGTFRIETPTGYWFIATVEGNLFSSEDNADDASDTERLVKYKATIKVPGYTVLADAPGIPMAIRKFVSAPIVAFSLGDSEHEQLIDDVPIATDPYEGADDPSAGFSLDGSIQPRENATLQESVNRVVITQNPFTGRDQTEYVRVSTRNSRNGEATLRPDDSVTIKII